MEGVMKTELHGKENPGKKLRLLLAPHPSTLLTPPLTRGPKLRAATPQRRDMIPRFTFSSLTHWTDPNFRGKDRSTKRRSGSDVKLRRRGAAPLRDWLVQPSRVARL